MTAEKLNSTLLELEHYFDNTPDIATPIELSKAETIYNLEHFVATNRNILHTYMPYIIRLTKLRDIIEEGMHCDTFKSMEEQP